MPSCVPNCRNCQKFPHNVTETFPCYLQIFRDLEIQSKSSEQKLKLIDVLHIREADKLVQVDNFNMIFYIIEVWKAHMKNIISIPTLRDYFLDSTDRKSSVFTILNQEGGPGDHPKSKTFGTYDKGRGVWV